MENVEFCNSVLRFGGRCVRENRILTDLSLDRWRMYKINFQSMKSPQCVSKSFTLYNVFTNITYNKSDKISSKCLTIINTLQKSSKKRKRKKKIQTPLFCAQTKNNSSNNQIKGLQSKWKKQASMKVGFNMKTIKL